MKSLDLENLVQKTKEELLGHEAKARSAERKAKAAAGMNRQAKLKLKQAKKLVKFTKKQARKERKEALATQQVFQDARIKFQQTEAKLLKKLKKIRAKSAPSQAQPAKRTPEQRAAAGMKPALVKKRRLPVKVREKAEPPVLKIAGAKAPLPATLPTSPIPANPGS
jgi:hypothetical protein